MPQSQELKTMNTASAERAAGVNSVSSDHGFQSNGDPQ
jgi:hypothetical protein